MPLHDWTRVPSYAYCDFHIGWLVEIRRVLNDGVLPNGYSAYVEQATRVLVRHSDGDRIAAVVEVVSPTNRRSEQALREFVRNVVNAVEAGIHALVIDPFPPEKHAPNGIHAAIWDTATGNHFIPSKDKPLTLVAYCSGEKTAAFVDPIAAGDPLPDMPLFLEPDEYINVPLERSYQIAYAKVLPQDRAKLEPDAAPAGS